MMDLSLTPGNLAGLVTGNAGGAAIKRRIGLDTKTYDWAKSYARDKKIREKIDGSQREMAQAKALPICKDELKAMFKSRVKTINDFRLRQLSAHLAGVQQRSDPLFNENIIDGRKFLGASMLLFFMQFSPEETDAIFADLPEGVREKDIENTIARCQEEIKKLEVVLEKELNPKERWFYREDGKPWPYPKGCRWTLFAETWKKVVARFEGKVDIEGCQLKTPEEYMAFGLLELEKVPKLPPLREPIREAI